MKAKKSTLKAGLLIAVIALLIAAIFFFLPKIIKFSGYVLWLFMPFVISYFISILVNPLADEFQKRFHLPRGASAVLVIIMTVGVIGGIATGVIWKIVDEVKGIYSDFPIIYDNINDTWNRLLVDLSRVLEILPDNFATAADSIYEGVMDWMAGIVADAEIVRSAGNAAKKLPSVFISIIVFIISLYFMIADSAVVTDAVKKPFSATFIRRISDLKIEIKKYIGGYVRAQLIIMCISFVILLVGLSVVGSEYTLIIALATSVVDALPFFGSGTVLIPWSIVSFVTGNLSRGVGLLIIYLCVIMMRQFVEPKLVSKNIGLHPIVTLMAMYIGYRVFSIGGMIVGPLLVMMLRSLYHVGFFDDIINFVKNLLLNIRKEIKYIKKSMENEGE